MKSMIKASLLLALVLMPVRAFADNDRHNPPSYAALKAARDSAVASETSGLNFHMWATVVNRDGVVCAIAFEASSSAGSGSAVGLALSTANLYSAVVGGVGVSWIDAGRSRPPVAVRR